MIRTHLAIVLLAAFIPVAVTAPPLPKPNDRAGLFDAKTQTSNDLRRVPVAPDTNAPKGTMLVRNARLFDGTGAAARNVNVVIEGNKIARIARQVDVPEGAEVIDARAWTVMPGLIDLHTHLTYVHAFGLPAPMWRSRRSTIDAV